MRPFETVHTMTDFYDGPRSGIADFDGRPHAYVSRLGDRQNDDDVYELRAVDEETLKLALEDWQIWSRWEEAFYSQKVTLETHPALPEDLARHEEIAAVLPSRLETLPGPVTRAHAEFRRRPEHLDEEALEPGRVRTLEVQWRPLGPLGSMG
ncbi:MAG TPA: hypothetical protein VM925_36900 [Labilithrix sp.]|nr:hypothetical protein [Labilithrix sp.]